MRMEVQPTRGKDEPTGIAVDRTGGVDLDGCRKGESGWTQDADVLEVHQRSGRSRMRTASSPSRSRRCTSTHSCREVGTFLPM